MKVERTALLHTASWTEVAKVQLAARAAWPKVIVWRKRAFTRATTGYEMEKYVEVVAAFPTEKRIKTRARKRT